MTWPAAISAGDTSRPAGQRSPAAANRSLAVGLSMASAEARTPEWV